MPISLRKAFNSSMAFSRVVSPVRTRAASNSTISACRLTLSLLITFNPVISGATHGSRAERRGQASAPPAQCLATESRV